MSVHGSAVCFSIWLGRSLVHRVGERVDWSCREVDSATKVLYYLITGDDDAAPPTGTKQKKGAAKKPTKAASAATQKTKARAADSKTDAALATKKAPKPKAGATAAGQQAKAGSAVKKDKNELNGVLNGHRPLVKQVAKGSKVGPFTLHLLVGMAGMSLGGVEEHVLLMAWAGLHPLHAQLGNKHSH